MTCQEPGEVPDEFMDGSQPLNDIIVFNFLMTGSGQVGDNPPFACTSSGGSGSLVTAG